jgi:hypothetical protein
VCEEYNTADSEIGVKSFFARGEGRGGVSVRYIDSRPLIYLDKILCRPNVCWPVGMARSVVRRTSKPCMVFGLHIVDSVSSTRQQISVVVLLQ